MLISFDTLFLPAQPIGEIVCANTFLLVGKNDDDDHLIDSGQINEHLQ